MKMFYEKAKLILLILTFFLSINLNFGLYIKKMDDNKISAKQLQKEQQPISDSQWTVFKSKLGLTDQKVQLLKSQKDQKATAELIKRFIRENPKYITIPAAKAADFENTKTADPNNFHGVYQGLIKELQAAKGSLKASLNFELADKTNLKNLKRSPRKIAFKMISDIPSEKIDELLKMFSEQHGLNTDDAEVDIPNYVDTADYAEVTAPITNSAETDYVYENLWEDEEAPHLPSGPQFGSFQDLIMHANRQRLEREMEETKLQKHFV